MLKCVITIVVVVPNRFPDLRKLKVMICNPSKLNNYPRPEEIALIRQRQQLQRTIKIMWALCFNATKISVFRNYSHFWLMFLLLIFSVQVLQLHCFSLRFIGSVDTQSHHGRGFGINPEGTNTRFIRTNLLF